MKKKQLAQRIAEQTGISTGEAADGLDTVVTTILEKLRRGKKVPMGHLGVFQPGPVTGFEFKKPAGKAGR